MGIFRKSASVAPRPHRPPHPPIPALEWTAQALGRTARITVMGSRRMMVENHLGILDFSDTCLRLNSSKGAIAIEGRDLTLRDVRKDALIVIGDLHRVQLPNEGSCADEG